MQCSINMVMICSTIQGSWITVELVMRFNCKSHSHFFFLVKFEFRFFFLETDIRLLVGNLEPTTAKATPNWNAQQHRNFVWIMNLYSLKYLERFFLVGVWGNINIASNAFLLIENFLEIHSVVTYSEWCHEDFFFFCCVPCYLAWSVGAYLA